MTPTQSLTIRMYLSSWRKIRRAIPGKLNESIAQYMDRVAKELWWATREEAKRQEVVE